MKFRVFTVPCTLLVSIALILTACEKEGPAGPAGPAGPQGPAGPTGATGPAGDTGTANVIYSDWLDVTYQADTVHNGNVIDTVGYIAEIDAPKLTNDILSNGEIKVYWNYGTPDNPVVFPLPLDAVFFNGLVITPYFQVGIITLYAYGNASTTAQNRFQYRYIIIPGGTLASTQGAAGRSVQVDWNNYAEVKKHLGLKE